MVVLGGWQFFLSEVPLQVDFACGPRSLSPYRGYLAHKKQPPTP